MSGPLAALALVLALLACGGEERSSGAPPAEPPAVPTPGTTPPTPEPPAAPPMGSTAPTAPAPPAAGAPAGGAAPAGGSLRGDAQAGALHYQTYCSTCHGKTGKGDGPAAPKNPPPADHTDPGRMGKLTDQEIFTTIQKGGAAVGKSPLMAPWGGVLNDQQIRDVLAYVRSLSKT